VLPFFKGNVFHHLWGSVMGIEIKAGLVRRRMLTSESDYHNV
jgi:hypothetical protein